jgi:hypothetical protein
MQSLSIFGSAFLLWMLSHVILQQQQRQFHETVVLQKMLFPLGVLSLVGTSQSTSIVGY